MSNKLELEAKERIIFALDVSTFEEVERWGRSFKGSYRGI